MLILLAVFGLLLLLLLVAGRIIDRRSGTTRHPPPDVNPTRIRGTRLGPGWQEVCTLCGETDPYAPGKFPLCPVAYDNQHLITRERCG